MDINPEANLRDICGTPKNRAEEKALSHLEKHAISFISKSPFVTVSTVAASGRLDCSPRGGEPGFVKVHDDRNLLIPDDKSNNKLDSLINVIETGQVGCLFLIPGIDEALRLDGSAIVSIGSKLYAYFSDEKVRSRSLVKVEANEMFLLCSKAFAC